MPNWCKDVNPWHLRICEPHRIISASVDPTGSPLTSTHTLPSSQCSSSLPNKHLSPKPFTNHIKLSSLLLFHHSHPSTFPHKPHLPSTFKNIFPPNPTLYGRNFTLPSPYIYPSILLHFHTTQPTPLPLGRTYTFPLLHILFFFFFFSSFFSCSRTSNILSLVWSKHNLFCFP